MATVLRRVRRRRKTDSDTGGLCGVVGSCRADARGSALNNVIVTLTVFSFADIQPKNISDCPSLAFFLCGIESSLGKISPRLYRELLE